MKKTKLFSGLGLSLLVWVATGCGTGPKQVQGTYTVTGSSGVTVNIVYALSGYGSNSQAISQTLPWSATFNAYESEGNYQGTYVYLMATNDLPNIAANQQSAVTILIQENGSTFQAPNYTNGGGSSVTLLGYF